MSDNLKKHLEKSLAPVREAIQEATKEVRKARAALSQPSVERITRLAQEFVESPNIHEAIADNGMTVADGFQEAFKQALAHINLVIGDKK